MVLMMNMIAATATTTTMMIMTMTWLRAVSLGQIGRRSRRADGFTSPRATKELFPTCGNVPCLAVLITIVIILLMSSLPSNVAIKLWSSLFFSWARPSISFVLYVLLGNDDETKISEPMMTRMKRKRKRRIATMKMTMVVVVVLAKSCPTPHQYQPHMPMAEDLDFCFCPNTVGKRQNLTRPLILVISDDPCHSCIREGEK